MVGINEEKKKDKVDLKNDKPKAPYIWIPKPITRYNVTPSTGEMSSERPYQRWKFKKKK